MTDTAPAAAAPATPQPCPPHPEKKAEEYIGLIKRIKVGFTATYGSLEIHEIEGIDCDGAPLLDSFPSTGVVSVLAGMQLVKTMELPLIAFFVSENIPMCSTLHNESLSRPARVYGNKKIVVFVCEFELDEAIVPDMVDAIYDFATRHKSPMIYSVEGKRITDKVQLPSGEEVALHTPDEEEGEEVKTYIDDTKLAELYMKEKGPDVDLEHPEEEKKDTESGDSKHQPDKKKKSKKKKKTDEEDEHEVKSLEQQKEELAEKLYGDKIHYLTTNSDMAAKLRGLGYIPVIDGIITNVSGGLLAKAAFVEHDLIVLLAPTSTLLPSPSSAVSLLKLLGQLLPEITICTSELEMLKEDIERVMKRVMASLPVGAKNLPPSTLYT